MFHDGQSAGVDRLHPEVIKRDRRRLVKELFAIKDAWENLEVSVVCKDAQLVTIYKKRDRRNYCNYSGISLLSMHQQIINLSCGFPI